MKSRTIRHGIRIGVVAVIFGTGFLCGSLTQNTAQAQLGQLGSDLMKQAEGSGGILGTAAELGNTIVDMEKNVNDLQKNIDVLKKVKAALGG
jgi:hypothetical protein